MRHTFTRNSTQLFEGNNLQLPSRRFSYRGAIPDSWAHTTTLFPCVIDTQVQQWLESLDVPPVSNDSVLMLACPECGHTKDCINQQLLKVTAWKTAVSYTHLTLPTNREV